SLGSVQPIRPGDVNWMVAGSGIVHSERTPPNLRAAGHGLHGIQSWVALPKGQEQSNASFTHHGVTTLPVVNFPGAKLRVIAGTAFGVTSPAKVAGETLYVGAELAAGATITLGADHAERAIYVVEGAVRVNGEPVAAHTMAVLNEGADVTIAAEQW